MNSPKAGPSSTWWDDRPITTKILGAVGVAAAVALIIGFVGLRALNAAADSSTAFVTDNVAGITQVDNVAIDLSHARVEARNAVLLPTVEETDAALGDFTVMMDDLALNLDLYRSSSLTAEQSALADQVSDVSVEYTTFVLDDLGPLARANDYAGWVATNSASGLGDQLDDLVVELRQTELDLAEEKATDASDAAAAQQRFSILVLAVGLTLSAVVGVIVARRMARQVARVQSVAEALAAGDLTVAAGLTSKDEVGRMAAALDAAVVDLRGVLTSVVASSDAVASASEELSASSSQISAAAEETSAQSGVVSAAADEVSRSVATVAAGAEQMGASIREIAQNANEAARVASQAVGVAATANATVTKLGASSKEIGDVVKTITSIAEQTNLLALNATIEAARAGEAGKGFAVVANEVKELAQETARATDDISRRVTTIQADTTGAVAAIDEISSIIASINDFQTTIASAVEEQTATTNEMSRSVAEAAGGSTEIAANITGVSTAAASTTEALSQTRTAVTELATLAADLRSKVARFTA